MTLEVAVESWILVVNWLARLILVLLVGLSVWSIKIILERRRYLKQIEADSTHPEVRSWIETGQKEKIAQVYN